MKLQEKRERLNSYVLPDSIYLKVHQVMEENVDDMASYFKVLSDPVRIRILRALHVSELCVCVLVEITDYKHSALSYHLKMLKDAELIDSKRDGNFQIYYLKKTGENLLRSIESSFMKDI